MGDHTEWHHAAHAVAEIADKGTEIGCDTVTEDCAVVIGTPGNIAVIEGCLDGLAALLRAALDGIELASPQPPPTSPGPVDNPAW